MKKKTLILLASPRKNGNSTALAKSLGTGVEDKGDIVEYVYLTDLHIEICKNCDSCQQNPEIGCTLQDDMQSLYPKLIEADSIVFASPIYWFYVNAQMKLLIDRLYALIKPNGHALKGKNIAIILAYGDSDAFSAGANNALRTYQDIFNYIEAKIVGMVYGFGNKAGEIKENKILMTKAYDLGYKLNDK